MRIPIVSLFFDFLHGNRGIMFNARSIIRTLSVKIGERSPQMHDNLQKSRKFIVGKFIEYGAEPVEETYLLQKREYANIIAEIPAKSRKSGEIILIGAHYDTVEGSCGANDNASGIAALLEIYRMLSSHRHARTIRFVAFTLEEPPHFNSETMGSMVHASKYKKKKEKIAIMISLDMLGFGGLFVKQQYPTEDMRKRYPGKGNFLSIASLPSYATYAYTFKKVFNHHCKSREKIHDIVAPASVHGINCSDHLSFHKHGIPAILISDTGHYRNEYYHTQHDTESTINYRFLSRNILQLSRAIRELADKPDIP